MNKRDFPKVHFYDQDFVDIYDRTWAFIQDFLFNIKTEKGATESFFLYPDNNGWFLNQYETIFSSFFFVYSNRNYNANQGLDFFYAHQEESGAIRSKYNVETGEPVFSSDNPEGVGMPLFAWAEYNMFHKTANKKRVKDVMPVLTRYMKWLDASFKQPNGLYSVPLGAVEMYNTPREKAAYLVDFNAAIAVNALYMSVLGDILNDKELSFQYKRVYFTLKTRINALMWNAETGFYHDIDANEQQLPQKTIAGFGRSLPKFPMRIKPNSFPHTCSTPKLSVPTIPFPVCRLMTLHITNAGWGR